METNININSYSTLSSRERRKGKKNFNIDTIKIENNNKNEKKLKMKKLEHLYLSEFEKFIIILKENKSTLYKIVNNENKISNESDIKENEIIEKMNKLNLNDKINSNNPLNKSFSVLDSTFISTNIKMNISNNSLNIPSNISSNNSIFISPNALKISLESVDKKYNLKFNQGRSNFCLKNRLFDIPLSRPNLNILTPEKYKINDQLFAFLYPNDLNTYYITQSGFLGEGNKNCNIKNNKDINYDKYPLLGIYFCGEEVEIKIENEIQHKKCQPNEFLCRQCMEINKKRYGINNKYFINIKGRVAKINKGSFHCFGFFLVEGNVQDCIKKFSCEACKLLNKYSKYFY